VRTLHDAKCQVQDGTRNLAFPHQAFAESFMLEVRAGENDVALPEVDALVGRVFGEVKDPARPSSPEVLYDPWERGGT
jgi:hypothetical protein